jgi:hypothetical protein
MSIAKLPESLLRSVIEATLRRLSANAALRSVSSSRSRVNR